MDVRRFGNFGVDPSATCSRLTSLIRRVAPSALTCVLNARYCRISSDRKDERDGATCRRHLNFDPLAAAPGSVFTCR
jgi:hypothetical protein